MCLEALRSRSSSTLATATLLREATRSVEISKVRPAARRNQGLGGTTQAETASPAQSSHLAIPTARPSRGPVGTGRHRASKGLALRLRHELGLLSAVLRLAAAIVVVVLSVAGSGSSTGSAHHRNKAAGALTAATPARHAALPEPSHTAGPPGTVAAATPTDLHRMLGQMIVARFSGPSPSASFLARIRAGQIGGVVLFGDNVVGGLPATHQLTERLQSAAGEGGNPPLLIMTDQEGGDIKRLPGPPTLAPSEMTSSSVAFDEGQATGRLLGQAGINVDLAPVADVERVVGSFLGTRSFGLTPSVVAQYACAFADGLASENVAYTLKHFPGLGLATTTTDLAAISIDAPRSDLRSDYQAYRTCGAGPLALVMISSAIYPSLSGPLPAVMSPAIYLRELPIATGAPSSLTISDDLQTPAIANQFSAAREAINASLDLLMYAETEQASADAYSTLLAEARAGLVSDSRIRAANQEIATLKRGFEP